MLRGDVEELRGEQRLVGALGEPGERQRDVAGSGADELAPPPASRRVGRRSVCSSACAEAVAELDQLEQRGVDEVLAVAAEDPDGRVVEVDDPQVETGLALALT